MAFTGALQSSSLTAEMGVFTTASERPNIKAMMRSYDGDERNRSWSRTDKMRLAGIRNESVELSGGEGREGVSGKGVLLSGV